MMVHPTPFPWRAAIGAFADGPPEQWSHALSLSFLVLGSAAFVFGFVRIILTFRFVRRASRAPCRVVGHRITHESSTASDGPIRQVVMYHPTIEFTTEKGETVRFESKVSSSSARVPGRRPLMVLYDPDRPVHAEIDSFLHLWFWEIFMSVLGAAHVVIGLWTLAL